jgi:hypothetical protein
MNRGTVAHEKLGGLGGNSTARVRTTNCTNIRAVVGRGSVAQVEVQCKHPAAQCKQTKQLPPVRCASAGAERRGGVLCADPAYRM